MDEFLTENFGLVAKYARRFQLSSSGNIWSDDVRQEGSVQLWLKFLKWDPDQGTFGSFVSKHVEGKVRRAVRKGEQQMLSDYDWEQRPNVFAAEKRLKEQFVAALDAGLPAKAPTLQEIASEAGCPVQTVRRIFSSRVEHLDAPVSEDTTLADLIGDDPNTDNVPAAQIHHVEQLATTRDAKGDYVLSAREVVVMAHASGILTEKRESHVAQATLLAGTSEKHRAAHAKAIKKVAAAATSPV